MEQLAETAEEDDGAWAARNEHWSTGPVRPKRYRAKRERNPDPLILCGHGVRLRIDHGALLIDDGFTHYPQERRTYRFFKGDLNLPPRIVMLDGSGGLSFDVISWLADQNVPLIRADYQGEVVSVIGGSGFAPDPERLSWQIETRNDPDKRLEFCCDLIAAKLRASLRTIADCLPQSKARQLAVARAEAGVHALSRRAISTVDQVREIEMRAAAAYFTAWRGFPLRWRGLYRHPVPDHWRAIGPRQSMRTSQQGNRNATHPVNAILNYAYGMLRSHAHIQAVADGYDPRRGILHHDRDDADAFAFVFDMMEPGRPVVDAAILKFLAKNELKGPDFAIRSDGVCRLAPQLARRICMVVNDQLRDRLGDNPAMWIEAAAHH